MAADVTKAAGSGAGDEAASESKGVEAEAEEAAAEAEAPLDDAEATGAASEWDTSACLTPRAILCGLGIGALHRGHERLPGAQDRVGPGRKRDGGRGSLCDLPGPQALDALHPLRGQHRPDVRLGLRDHGGSRGPHERHPGPFAPRRHSDRPGPRRLLSVDRLPWLLLRSPAAEAHGRGGRLPFPRRCSSRQNSSSFPHLKLPLVLLLLVLGFTDGRSSSISSLTVVCLDPATHRPSPSV